VKNALIVRGREYATREQTLEADGMREHFLTPD
jgi:hypothetical protein